MYYTTLSPLLGTFLPHTKNCLKRLATRNHTTTLVVAMMGTFSKYWESMTKFCILNLLFVVREVVGVFREKVLAVKMKRYLSPWRR